VLRIRSNATRVGASTHNANSMPSTVIRDFYYNAAKQELLVIFQAGRRYAYTEVPEEIYQGMNAAFSKGDFFNTHVRDQFQFVRNDDSTP